MRLDFAQKAGGHVINETTNCDLFGHPWMRPELLYLFADVSVDIPEGEEMRGRNRSRSSLILDSGTHIFFSRLHHAAIRVVDHHEFLRAKQVMRDKQRTQGIVRDDAAGVPNDVRIARFESKCADRQTRIHAREHRDSTLRTRRQLAQFVRVGINLVRG